MNLLKDWQFWGVVVGILGIVSAVIIYLLQRNKKRLSYSMLTQSPLLSVSEEVKGKITIAYDGVSIQNIYLVLMRIENNGNVDITSSDYEQPIVFTFDDSEILSVEIVDVSPKNLKPVITSEASKITINRILLNKRDNFTIKLLFSKYQRKINIDARIVGVKEIENITESDFKYEVARIVLIYCVVLVGALLIQGIQFSNSAKTIIYGLMFGLILYTSLPILSKYMKK